MSNPMLSQLSPAMAWLQQLWDVQRTPTRYAQRVNMPRALFIAIEMRLRFAREDFVWLITNQEPSHGDTTPFGRSLVHDGEQAYQRAIAARNMSAVLAIEHWKQRPPYLWEGKRIFVGWQTWWEAKHVRVHCTSFKPDGSAVVLCSHVPHAANPCATCGHDIDQYARDKILHRYVLTPEQCREAAPAKKESYDRP